MQAVPAARCPSGDQADHHLGHKPDEPLYLEDVQPPRPRWVDSLGCLTGGVLITAAPTNALIPTRAERPYPSLGDGPFPVNSTTPTSGDIRAWSKTRYISSTECGRNALRTSGRLNATRTVASLTWR